MQSPNQFRQSVEKGQLDLVNGGSSTISCQVDTTQATPLVAGQAVKIVDSAGGIPKIIAVAADTDDVFGFVNYDIKDAEYKAEKVCQVSVLAGNIMYMQSSAAIARYAKVMVVPVGNKVATAVGPTKMVVGRAIDKATAADQIIRVAIVLPCAVLGT